MDEKELLRGFGTPSPHGTPEYDRAKKLYRRLARQYHPDKGGDGTIFKLLVAAWEKYDRMAANGGAPLFSVKLAGVEYVAEAPLAVGEASQLFKGTSTSGMAVVLKLMNDPKDFDLLKTQHDTLTKLRGLDPPLPIPYFMPNPLAIGQVNGRGILAMEAYDGELVSLRTMFEAWPAGLDIRDMVWMWRKGLTILDFLHTQQLVHGAINPDHLLFDLENHGLHLAGWTSVVKEGEKLKVLDRNWTAHSAPEALAGEPVSHATDLFDLATHMGKLLGDQRNQTHPRFISALKACLTPEARHRPHRAGWLYDHLDELIDQVLGGRKFRPLSLPERKD